MKNSSVKANFFAVICEKYALYQPIRHISEVGGAGYEKQGHCVSVNNKGTVCASSNK